MRMRCVTEKSVLEKLKAAQEALKNDYDMCTITEDDGRCWAIDFSGPECEDIYQLFLSLPNLIAALELVEAKALQSKRKDSGYWPGFHDGMVTFAREVLAVINGETKGE